MRFESAFHFITMHRFPLFSESIGRTPKILADNTGSCIQEGRFVNHGNAPAGDRASPIGSCTANRPYKRCHAQLWVEIIGNCR
jgi:hypothetical protein